ncbi:MAG TPA: NADH-quinone oxidoreductase subunit D [Dehalococcoidia bacterium]|nr:NADH-quinone oxidoreductase subunit D [Dehalococcoidia bacterium]
MPFSQAGEPVLVNIGPQHPSTHGVLRLRALLDGEVIIDLEPVFGYLHSSMEKLAELRTYTQAITLTDRMDYLAAMSNNLAACLAIEKLADIPVPERALYLRLIMVELQRIASHCMFLGTYPNECGAWSTPWMYSFRDREKILDMFEMCCGQRLTYNYIRPGGVAQDVPPEFAIALRVFLKDMPSRVAEYEELLVENEILIARSKHIGILSREQAINASASGPVLRGSGVLWDIRKADPYLIYDRYDFDVPVGEIGDCWDRFWVRMEEIKESLRILHQCFEEFVELPPGPYRTPVDWVFHPPAGREIYSRIESPRGELGYYLVSDGGANPYRFRVRGPSQINLTALKDMTVGHKVADAIAILGSIDIVMGEVDR